MIAHHPAVGGVTTWTKNRRTKTLVGRHEMIGDIFVGSAIAFPNHETAGIARRSKAVMDMAGPIRPSDTESYGRIEKHWSGEPGPHDYMD